MVMVSKNIQTALRFDSGRSGCAFVAPIDGNPVHSRSIVSLFFDRDLSKSSAIKRRTSRYKFVDAEAKTIISQGDHVFPFSSINLIIAFLFSNILFDEFEQRIHKIFHPWLKCLYNFNLGFLNQNEQKLGRIGGFYNYFNAFQRQSIDFEELYNLIDSRADTDQHLEDINEYMNLACIFYHNLPLIVFGNGPAGKDHGVRPWNKFIKEAFTPARNVSPNMILTSMGYILPNLIDQEAMKNLMANSSQESYGSIIEHFALHVYFATTSQMRTDSVNSIVEKSTNLFISNQLDDFIIQFLGLEDLGSNFPFRALINDRLGKLRRLLQNLTRYSKSEEAPSFRPFL